ncbi:MAG TPA: fumarylacetoacetate hydrolase family protein [Rhodospirillaceae bacterium]|nr:fumarylacetoacetate hydrolase family protein [Rhodospirillaceae bacterium]
MPDYVFPPPSLTCLPVAGGGAFPVRRIFCVGQNYSDHAREMGSDPTRQPPFFFTKPADAVTCGPKVPYPPMTERLDYEGELVVGIGEAGADIAVETARRYIFGYTVGCDLTRRDLQADAKKAGRPWDMAKGFDCSAAVGVLHPATEIGHPDKGSIRLLVNGEEKQKGDLSQMTWSVPEIIAHLSRYVRLAPGDLIFTGTPAGVGPLAAGDRVEVIVEAVTAHKFTIG